MFKYTELPTSNTLNQYTISVLFMTFQYFSENLAYYAPIMLILKPKFQYFSEFLQYFASKISTSTEESVQLEALSIAQKPEGSPGGTVIVL